MLIKIKVSEKDIIWFGKHSILGPFIFDKKRQFGFGILNIYIFKFDNNLFSKFKKKYIKDNLEKIDKKYLEKYKIQINKYIKEISNRRSTHCYNCKRDLNSGDNSKCNKCSWLSCICGRCGCQYIRYE